jgi:type I restriction enzyme S subunit
MSEHRQIGSFANQVKRINEACISNADVYSVTKYDGFVRSLDYFKKQVFSRDLSSYKIVKRGEFAYSTIHLDEGAIGLLGDEEALISPMYTTFQVDESVDKIYLSYLLKSPKIVSRYGLIGQGSVNRRKSVPFSSLAEVEVFTPPVPEQKKIAEILSGIDRQITLYRHSLEKLAILERATIRSTIDRIEKIDSNCRQLRAGEICRKIFVGIASSTTHAYTDNTGVPMLRNQNIKLGTIDSTDLVYIKKEFAEEQRSKRLIQGDVITARTGYPGASAVVGREFENCHSFTTLISRVETDIVIPEYYSLYLNSPQGKAQVAQLQAGGAQENLNVGALEKMIIPVPDLHTQNGIIKASEELLKTFRAKESVIRKRERLRDALSSDLLSGRKRVSV